MFGVICSIFHQSLTSIYAIHRLRSRTVQEEAVYPEPLIRLIIAGPLSRLIPKVPVTDMMLKQGSDERDE